MTEVKNGDDNNFDDNSRKNHRLVLVVTLFLVIFAVFTKQNQKSERNNYNYSNNAINNHINKNHRKENYTVQEQRQLDNSDSMKLQQVENYKQNKSLILNIHITHHAGTTACAVFKQYGPTPNFACLTDENWPSGVPNSARTRTFPVSTAWTEKETNDTAIQKVRDRYNMIAWEFSASRRNPNPPLSDTNWEHPHLLSILIVRHPMDRLLAGDGYTSRKFGPFPDLTPEKWWKFASGTYVTNNFALTILAGNGCCNGTHTEDYHLETAKKLVSRFTFILDQECLTEGVLALVEQLGLPAEPAIRILDHSNKRRKTHKSAKERIHNSTLYDYLLERNRLDIALYEWAKTKSIINCGSISSNQSTITQNNNDGSNNINSG